MSAVGGGGDEVSWMVDLVLIRGLAVLSGGLRSLRLRLNIAVE